MGKVKKGTDCMKADRRQAVRPFVTMTAFEKALRLPLFCFCTRR